MTPIVKQWIEIFSTYGWVLLLVLMERVWFIYKQPLLREGLTSDIIYTYQNLLLQLLIAASAPVALENILAAHIALNFFPAHSGFLQGSLAQQALWINLVALVIVGEVAFYTAHYFAHKIPFLWEFHRVHHSSVTLDSLSTSRFHIFDRLLFNFPLIIFMVYAAARLEAIVIYYLFRAFMDRYIHSNINGPRWVHKLMISSPHFHRWHHCPDPAVRDHNYSGDFIFMDVLFGTAYDPDPKDKPPPNKFGEPSYSNDFLVQQVMPFIHLYRRFSKSVFKQKDNSSAQDVLGK